MDVIHGYAKLLFPFRWDFLCTWDEFNWAHCRIAHKKWADGVNWIFSPMVDISRDPRWEEYLKVQEKILLGSQIAKQW
jgi:beta-glucosidase